MGVGGEGWVGLNVWPVGSLCSTSLGLLHLGPEPRGDCGDVEVAVTLTKAPTPPPRQVWARG